MTTTPDPATAHAHHISRLFEHAYQDIHAATDSLGRLAANLDSCVPAGTHEGCVHTAVAHAVDHLFRSLRVARKRADDIGVH